MSPGLLVAIVTLAWVIALIGLLRLTSAMEQAERLMNRLDATGRMGQEPRRG